MPADLDREVEINVAYLNGHVRPAKRVYNCVDRCLKRNQDPMKRAVLVAHERHDVGSMGGYKTVTGVAKAKSEHSEKNLVARHIEAVSTIAIRSV